MLSLSVVDCGIQRSHFVRLLDIVIDSTGCYSLADFCHKIVLAKGLQTC